MIKSKKWFKLVCKSYQRPPVIADGIKLPGFPPDEIQVNTTGQSGIPTLKEAYIFYEDCINQFSEMGRPLKSDNLLLDFGVGWGRITRYFLRELPLNKIYGIDVMEDFINICKESFESDNFYLTSPFPPSQFSESMFDYIIGYSVFSHLSEEACMAWMKEFNRILKPNGVVALTTRGRTFFDFCESLDKDTNTGYLKSLAMLFDDFSDARKKYDSGQFVYSNREGVNGGGAMTADFYGETFIPEDYARKAYSDYFHLTEFIFDEKRQTHPIMFFQKKRE